MRLLFSALVTMVVSVAASANSPEVWLVKSAACSSGQLQSDKTLAIGSLVEVPIVRAVETEHGGTLLETQSEAVVSVIISGYTDGSCANDGEPTILTLTFVK